MSLDLPADLTSRPPTAADAQSIFGLAAACETADDGMSEVDEDDIATSFERHGFDPTLDSVLVFDGSQLVAWAETYRWRVDTAVLPSHRGRGIGSALLHWAEARGRERSDGEAIQVTSDANVRARELFLSNGYEPSGVSWVIRMALDDAIRAPEPPPGITIRPYRSSDARDVHRVIDDAFSEWEGRDPVAYEIWAPMIVDHPALSAELSPLAFDGEELVGVVISFDFPEVDEGWIEQLATRATHRNRGIAQALLRTAFAGFRERGRKVAGVSTDSRTGALGLYEKVGMKVVRQYTRYAKPLR